MTIITAIILGILQGLSEFIPISSTAHLTIAGKFLGLIDSDNPHHWTAFIAVIQLGTLAAVLVYFKKDIIEIISAFLRENISSKRISLKSQSLQSKLAWFIIAGSIPIATAGLALKKVIEGNITKDFTVIAVSLIVLALFLALAERIAKFRKEIKDITLFDSIIVGTAQCLALIPGSSRSGTTITAGLFLGMKREAAARFSFLLSIPAIFASGLYEFYQQLSYITSDDLLNIVIATIFSALSGYVAIAFLINFLKKHSTYLFIYYRIGLGLLLLILVCLFNFDY